MSWKPYGYARVPVASDADVNNLETQHPVLADCEQDFEDVGSGASWNRPGLNRLKAVLQPRDCVKVAALDRLGRSLTEVLDLLGWLRENQVEAISLRESIDQDSAMGGDAAPRHRLRGDGARPGPGENTGGAGAGKCHRLAPVQRQLLLPVPSIILAGSPPVSDCAAGPLRCGSWGRRIPG